MDVFPGEIHDHATQKYRRNISFIHLVVFDLLCSFFALKSDNMFFVISVRTRTTRVIVHSAGKHCRCLILVGPSLSYQRSDGVTYSGAVSTRNPCILIPTNLHHQTHGVMKITMYICSNLGGRHQN